jgi:hypothetical protein
MTVPHVDRCQHQHLSLSSKHKTVDIPLCLVHWRLSNCLLPIFGPHSLRPAASTVAHRLSIAVAAATTCGLIDFESGQRWRYFLLLWTVMLDSSRLLHHRLNIL